MLNILLNYYILFYIEKILVTLNMTTDDFLQAIDSYKNYSDIPDSIDNPFIETLSINTKLKLSRYKKNETINNEEGTIDLKKVKELEIEQERLKGLGIEIGKLVTKKSISFVFMFNTPILNYEKLSLPTFKILFYILDEKLYFNKDYIIISIRECCLKFNLTLPTVCKSFTELVNNKILSKRLDNVWWINPNYFYVGDREKIFKNIEKK